MKTKKSEKRFLIGVVGLLIILLPCMGQAEIPDKINYQGYLTNAGGVPVNGTVAIVFTFYTVATGGSPIWSETQNVTVNHGVYNVNLGEVTLITSLPFGLPYYLGIKVGTDSEMTPRIPLTSVGYAFRAKTADYVYGSGTFSNTIISTVTTGTAPMQVSSTTNVTNLNADLLDGQHAAAFSPASHIHDDRYYDKAYVNALEARIAALETKLSGFTRSGTDFIITNANLYIQSGNGATNGAVNGKGNLIIGYNELRGTGDIRTGSHNLVVGPWHNYSSYGGIVVGLKNTISDAYASVSGGHENIASSFYSLVSGGVYNTASGPASSVTGGANNNASGSSSSVSGGRYNVASGDYSSVAGGGTNNASWGNKAFGHYTAILGGADNKAGDPGLSNHNIGQSSTVSGGGSNIASDYLSSVSGGTTNVASGLGSTVSGGESNTANGSVSSVSGGRNNTASNWGSSVSGGGFNVASGEHSSVAGGGSDNASFGGNKAIGHYSAILGGFNNKAGDPALVDNNIGKYSTISGGWGNVASGPYSSVSGGGSNIASAADSSVSGGAYNTASGWSSLVSGGEGNNAGGDLSAAIGGYYNTITSSGASSTVVGGMNGNFTSYFGCSTCLYILP